MVRLRQSPLSGSFTGLTVPGLHCGSQHASGETQYRINDATLRFLGEKTGNRDVGCVRTEESGEAELGQEGRFLAWEGLSEQIS